MKLWSYNCGYIHIVGIGRCIQYGKSTLLALFDSLKLEGRSNPASKHRSMQSFDIFAIESCRTEDHSTSGLQTCKKQRYSTQLSGNLVCMTPSIMAAPLKALSLLPQIGDRSDNNLVSPHKLYLQTCANRL